MAPSVKLSNGLTCAKNQPTSAGNDTRFSRIRGATEGGRATVNEHQSKHDDKVSYDSDRPACHAKDSPVGVNHRTLIRGAVFEPTGLAGTDLLVLGRVGRRPFPRIRLA